MVSTQAKAVLCLAFLCPSCAAGTSATGRRRGGWVERPRNSKSGTLATFMLPGKNKNKGTKEFIEERKALREAERLQREADKEAEREAEEERKNESQRAEREALEHTFNEFKRSQGVKGTTEEVREEPRDGAVVVKKEPESSAKSLGLKGGNPKALFMALGKAGVAAGFGYYTVRHLLVFMRNGGKRVDSHSAEKGSVSVKPLAPEPIAADVAESAINGVPAVPSGATVTTETDSNASEEQPPTLEEVGEDPEENEESSGEPGVEVEVEDTNDDSEGGDDGGVFPAIQRAEEEERELEEAELQDEDPELEATEPTPTREEQDEEKSPEPAQNKVEMTTV